MASVSGGMIAAGGPTGTAERLWAVTESLRDVRRNSEIWSRTCRLPSASVGSEGGRRSEATLTATGVDCVVPAVHAKCVCIVAVTFGLNVTGSGGMVAMSAETVRPAII